MLKLLASIIFSILITSNILAHHHTVTEGRAVGNGEDSSGLAHEVNFIKKHKQHTYSSKIFYRYDKGRDVSGLNLKYKKKAKNNLNYGFTAHVTRNERNDNDWRDVNEQWIWLDKNDIEFSSTVFTTLRIPLGNPTTTKYLLELTGYGSNNWTEELLTISPEAKLTYFSINNGNFDYALYFKLRSYIPLNFGDKDIYKNSLYIGYLYNYSPNLKPYFFIVKTIAYWTKSKEFDEDFPGEQGYDYKSNLNHIGLGINIYL